jgi:hypothetical protein
MDVTLVFLAKQRYVQTHDRLTFRVSDHRVPLLMANVHACTLVPILDHYIGVP